MTLFWLGVICGFVAGCIVGALFIALAAAAAHTDDEMGTR